MKSYACEDCGDEIPEGHRRRRCKRCGLLVCPWCRHHVHNHLVQGGKS